MSCFSIDQSISREIVKFPERKSERDQAPNIVTILNMYHESGIPSVSKLADFIHAFSSRKSRGVNHKEGEEEGGAGGRGKFVVETWEKGLKGEK